ncbi:MAG: alpha/beta hydrolase, partial [Pseudomonadota bacterium]
AVDASVSATIIRAVTGWYVKGLDASKAKPSNYRSLLNVFGLLLIPAFGVRADKTTVAGIAAEWLTPKKTTPGKVLLYLHGGGFVMGSTDSHRQFVGHVARAGQIKALVPEYRLAPDHKFPAGLDDCVAVYRALLTDGVNSGDIILAGDSAGGGLTAATLIALRDAGDPLPAAALLFSPLLDATLSGESMHTRKEADPWFTRENIGVVIGHYCEPGEETHPLVSPVFADMQGLPPLFIQVGDREILLSDSERFADRQRDAGGEVEIEVWPGMWHVFQFCVNKMPESRRAIKKIGEVIQRYTA